MSVDELYRAQNANLLGALRNRFPRVEQARLEDALQFAWAQLLSWGGERDGRWVFVVAHNEVLRHLGRDRRLVGIDELSPMPANEPDTDARLDAEAMAARVRATLSDRQVCALGYKAFGFTYEQTARATGWSLRTVERQTLRGRQRALTALAS